MKTRTIHGFEVDGHGPDHVIRMNRALLCTGIAIAELPVPAGRGVRGFIRKCNRYTGAGGTGYWQRIRQPVNYRTRQL